MKAVGAAALGVAAGPAWAMTPRQDATTPGRKRALRIAHLTDVHVEPERAASDGMIACLHHVQGLADKPELILTGGDSVFDSFEADDARTALQWTLWRDNLRNENSIAVRSCIGNHDIWGWSKKASKTTGSEPNWGKKRATEMLHLDERYYAFPAASWQVVVLDSTQPAGEGSEDYVAALDEPQFDWLERTLRDTPAATPVMIVSHIPIISATPIIWAKDEQGNFSVSSALMHTDCVKLKDLFAKHPNVKLCLSGHMHLVDRVDYNGVTYLCNGAVCGSWWKGRHQDCDEGYAVLDLYDDGTFEHEYVKYGWKADPA